MVKKTFLGLDLSTQGLKAVIIDANLSIIFETGINFDKDLPEFGTEGGALVEGETVTAPSIMFVKALDLILVRLAKANIDLSSIKAISGSGQQHGSVWLNSSAKDKLLSLSHTMTLEEQLTNIFTLSNGPIWMDSSTGKYCRELESIIGGSKELARITGSSAFERFTGNQIAKYFYSNPEIYKKTERICLISSFIPSLLIGDFAAIDFSDGSGMNILDINEKHWNQTALNYAGGETLQTKLGKPLASHTVAGNISKYFVDRYGFATDSKVILFSGDNPNSLAGLAVSGPNDVIISLGTSDTIFGATKKATPSEERGHVFISPMNPTSYMVMLVKQNGSLTREKIRDQKTKGSWNTFSKMVASTPAGNNGKIGFYFFTPEITPFIKNTGVFRFNSDDQPVDSFTSEEEARAVYESQFMSLRLHSEQFGLKPDLIIATGGASVDRTLTSIIADVFGKPVAVTDTPDSAAIGAAYRAIHGYICNKENKYVPYTDVTAKAKQPKIVAKPNMKNHEVYNKLLPRFEALEKTLK